MNPDDVVATVSGSAGESMDLTAGELLLVKQRLLAAASHLQRSGQPDAPEAEAQAAHEVQMEILSATERTEFRWALVVAATQLMARHAELADEHDVLRVFEPWIDDFKVDSAAAPEDQDPTAEAEQEVAETDHPGMVARHLREEVGLAREAVSILWELLEFARQMPKLAEEANSLAGWLCLRRSLEQLRLAFYASIAGHHTEVPLLARAVYESAGLARMLAVEPEAADQWVHNPPWQKDKQVRDWIRDRGGDADAYAEYYSQASELAHTKLASMRPLLPELDRGLPVGSNPFEVDIASASIRGVTSAGLFAIHCYRNAGISDDLLPIPLRKRIVDLHGAAGGVTDHLDQDWEAIRRRTEELADRVNRAVGLDQRLAEDPLSYQNLRADDDSS